MTDRPPQAKNVKSNLKPVIWISTTRKDLITFPDTVQDDLGYALYFAQLGGKHSDAKPLQGFGGAGVLEIVENFDGNTFRAVYTVRFEDAIYVLHVFQKKSKRGIETPRHDRELVRMRLRQAEEIYTLRKQEAAKDESNG